MLPEPQQKKQALPGGPLAKMWTTTPELSPTDQNARGVKKLRDMAATQKKFHKNYEDATVSPIRQP